MSYRLPLLLGLVLLLPPLASTASAAHRSDRDLAAALRFWRAQHCTFAPDQTAWESGWQLNSLFGNCRAEDGHDQHVYFFNRGRFVGSDGLGTSSEVISLWRDDRTFAFLYVLYRPHDALCCPTGGGVVIRFRWNGTGFRRLDPALPRQDGTHKLGR